MTDWFGLEIQFSCAHFYRQKKWTEQKNREVFGKCFTEYGHGHDYVLQADFPLGAVSTEQAFEALRLLREELDHQHLNFVIPEFRDQIPTTENLLLFCKERLGSRLGRQLPLRLTLWETSQIGATTGSV